MAFLIFFLVVLGAIQQALAIPSQFAAPAGEACTNPRVRKEWRSLTVEERIKYTQAVNCLMSKPAKFKKYFPVVENRYDDFVALHVNQTEQSSVEWTNGDGSKGSFTPKHNSGHDDVHGPGSILPWHRYAITIFEDALVAECGWKGGVPYWNWFLDTPDGGGSYLKSPIFDPISGFGGNGKKVPTSEPAPYIHSTNGGGCLTNGPFKNRTIRIGPFGKMKANNTRCLRRDLNSKVVEAQASKKVLGKIMKAKTYKEFCEGVNGALHAVGHGGIGGEMSDEFNSINDPLFFLHHANLDYLWALWEEQDLKRLTDYSAQLGEGFSKDTRLEVGVYAPTRLVKEVIDSQNRDGKGILCFLYEGVSRSIDLNWI